MLELTDLQGNTVYFNSTGVILIREVRRGETVKPNAGAAIVTYTGIVFVKESPEEAVREWRVNG